MRLRHVVNFRATISLMAVAVLLVVGLLFTDTNHANADPLPTTQIAGELSASQTWDNDHVWYVTSQVTVPDGVVLSIEAGTIVKTVASTNSISVLSGGTLDINGSSGNEVVFTSYKDDGVGGDSNGDGASTASNNDYGIAILGDGGTISVEYSTFQYAANSYRTYCPSGAGVSTFTDNEFKSQVSLGDCQQGSIVLQRNHFTVDDYPIYASSVDANIITLSGTNKNTFSGTGTSVALYLGGSTNEVPASSTWTVDNDGGLDVVYVNGGFDGLQVNGTLNLESGIIVKVEGIYSSAATVGSSGTLNINGTSTSKVIFTSARDDSVGGDSNNDGSYTAASTGDFSVAIQNNGGTVVAAHTVLRYPNTALKSQGGTQDIEQISIADVDTGIYFTDSNSLVDTIEINNADNGIIVSEGQAKFTDANITDTGIGLNAYADAKVAYRGSFDNMSDRAIYACNWDQGCAVDASYANWNNGADGPFEPSGTDLVCGSVSVSPWVYSSTTYDEPVFKVKNCDDSPTPQEQLASSITYFQSRVSDKQIDCSNDYQDACDAIQTAYACLTSAVNLASSAYPVPIPPVDTAMDVNAFGASLTDATGSYISAQAPLDPVGDGMSFVGKFLGVIYLTLEMHDAYQTCSP